MISKWLTAACLTGALLTAAAVPAASANPTGGEPEDKEQAQEHGYRHGKGPLSREEIEAHKLKKLRYMAEYFGIKTEGKTAEQLKSELDSAREKDKAKWEAFKAEHKAKRLEKLRKIAAMHGISTEGKTAEQLREELRKLHKNKEAVPRRTDGLPNTENGAPQASPEAVPVPKSDPAAHSN